jgi:hypothetical protein
MKITSSTGTVFIIVDKILDAAYYISKFGSIFVTKH